MIDLLRVHVLFFITSTALFPGSVCKLFKVSPKSLVIALFLLRVFQVLSAEVENGIAWLPAHLVELRLDVLLVDIDLAILSFVHLALLRKGLSPVALVP